MHDVRDFATPQDALDAVTGEGGAVYFPHGTYKITESLRPKSGTKIVGDGPASLITCPDAGFPLVSVTGYGLINVDNKQDVVVSGVRVRGTKSQDINNTPKLVYLHNSTGVEITACWLEHTAFEGVWQGGTQNLTRRIRVVNNELRDVGFPAANFGGLPAIQMNAEDCVISGNILSNVGTGIGASGARTVVTSNEIDAITSVGIGLGDGGLQDGMVVANNSIRIEGDQLSRRRGIYITGPSDYEAVIDGNSVLVDGKPGDVVPYGIFVSGLKYASVTNNTVDVRGFGNGISGLGGVDEAIYTFTGNHLIIRDDLDLCYALSASPAGNDRAIFIASQNNRVHAVNPNFAIYYQNIGGGQLTAIVDGDIVDGGVIRVGNQTFSNGELSRTPISLAHQ